MKMNKRFALALTLLALLSCKAEKTESSPTEEPQRLRVVTPREQTLHLVGFQWGEPYTFNPLNGWPAWPIRPEFNLMYEQLTKYNSLTNKTEPLLARIDTTTNDYVSVIMNREAKWSDGKQLTAADVKFTYEFNLLHSEAPHSYIADFIDTVTVDTLNTNELIEEKITFHVNKKKRNNPLVIVDLLSTIQILPQHVWEPQLNAVRGEVNSLAMDVMDRGHIISGPYNLHDYSKDQIILKRRDEYWGNSSLYGGETAKPKFIVHPIYKDNKASLVALRDGAIDISANYIPSAGKEKKINTWIDSSPYYRYGAIPMFIINTTKSPLDKRHFRRAMAFAIDYDAVNSESFFGYSPKINSGLILQESKYFSQDENEKYGATRFDPMRAREELKRAGIKSHYKDTTISRGDTTYGDIQFNTIDGDTLSPLYIKSPKGWSDFYAIVNAAVKSMRKCGIDVRESFVDASDYWPSMSTGEFDLLLDTPSQKQTASMPYSRFERVISSRNWKYIGEKMFENSGRFNEPNSEEYISEVDSLLNKIPLMRDEKEKEKAYTTLNRHFMEQQPTLPLLYRPEEFYHFNTKFWKNFPVQKENGTIPPHLPVSGSARDMLWQITPAK